MFNFFYKVPKSSIDLSTFTDRTLSSFFHVSFLVYPDGRVCISILHAPGDDPMGYETSAERWSPVQSVVKILLSVVSMLAGTYYNRTSIEFETFSLN